MFVAWLYNTKTSINFTSMIAEMDPQEIKKLKRSLFAGKPEPLECYPVHLKRKYPAHLQAGFAVPAGQPIKRERQVSSTSTETSVEKNKTEMPVGVIPVRTGWLNVPVPLKWRPAVIFQLDARNSASLMVPVPWYAINPAIP